jgi:hypothetical protein
MVIGRTHDMQLPGQCPLLAESCRPCQVVNSFFSISANASLLPSALLCDFQCLFLTANNPCRTTPVAHVGAWTGPERLLEAFYDGVLFDKSKLAQGTGVVFVKGASN